MIPEREVVQYDRKSPLIFQSLYLAAVLTMKRSHNFEPAALLAAPLPRTFLLFSALLATLSAPVSAGEPQRQSEDLPSAAGHESPGLSVVAQLGRKMFYDPALSSSGQLSCASCHAPRTPTGLRMTSPCSSAGAT
jgi:cytochrome c peroxidase